MKQTKSKKHMLWIIPLVIIGVIAGAITYFGIHNGKIMNETADKGA